jgi:4-hydroxy-3-methylbut-2-enyl diphosphate reductase
MIHNQEVNDDLVARGVKFIMDTDGRQIIPWDALNPDDIVIIPAFGTTIEIEHLLLDRGIEVQKYNTTCPFVEKVWNRSEKLGAENYTIIIHGKPRHEETRATFSHSAANSPSVIVRDMEDARRLGEIITGAVSTENFFELFRDRYSDGFDPHQHLTRVGVVNQTTMLAVETQAIADFFRQVMMDKFGKENIREHFADTRDTLCYATNDNQDATYRLLETEADLAIVVGGYNSSNTSHIVELCEKKFPTYFVNSEKEIKSPFEIQHFNYPAKKLVVSSNYLPSRKPVRIVLTSGASCPDTLVDRVMLRILEFFENAKPLEEVLADFK